MIIFKREHGYPVDLKLSIRAEEYGWYSVMVKIDGKDCPDLGWPTKDPEETRKRFAKGFFAGYTYAENKRA